MNAEHEVYEAHAASDSTQSHAPGAPAPAPIHPRPAEPRAPLSPADERTWAMMAHLTVLLNLLSANIPLGIGAIAALVIYLIYKDRSRYVAFQAMQAFLFQLIFGVGMGVIIGLMWAIVGALTVVFVGVLLIPFAIILSIVLGIFPIIVLPIYGIIGAVQASNGKDFRYWLISDLAYNLI